MLMIPELEIAAELFLQLDPPAPALQAFDPGEW